jgi:glycosyltransferase involved in cell wall biosynthesis
MLGKYRERDRQEPDTPVVSVVTAVKNGEATLEETVESIRRQSLTGWELLIVDDGSTDGTPDLLERLSDHERIRLFSSPGLGPAGARNVGIAEARGRYVAILDADDIAMPERLAEQVGALESAPALAAVGSAAYHFVRRGLPAGVQPGHPTSRDELRSMLEKGMLITWSHSTMCWRKRALEELGGFDERFSPSEDAELLNRALYERNMTVLGLPKPLVWYRLSRNSLSSGGLRRQRMIARYLEMRNECWLHDRPVPDFEDFMARRPTTRERTRWARHDLAAGLYREAGYRVASGRRGGVVSRVLLSAALHPRYVIRKLWRQRFGSGLGRT